MAKTHRKSTPPSTRKTSPEHSKSNSSVQFTDQQALAIHTRGVSIALSAGAGCGKTFVLTQRYLSGLEPGGEDQADLHSLVAFTFTDRAAREMRDRIRAACHARLQSCSVEDVDHWLTILRGLDAARVSTIHSFCTGLLRSQAVEAGLDPRFSVLERALSDTLLRHVVRDTLYGMIERQDEDATQLVIDFGLERAQDILRRLIVQRFQFDFDAFEALTPRQLADSWITTWQTHFVPKLIADFLQKPIIEQTLSLMTEVSQMPATMHERFGTLNSLLTPPAWTDWRRVLPEIRESAYIKGATKKHWKSEELYEQVKDIFTDLRDEVKALLDRLQRGDGDPIDAATLSCRVLRLTRRMAEEYSAAKQAQGVLDFDDLLLRARDLLRDHSHVRQRVAAGIRLLMVDEFQDTDPVQADLVRSLCGSSLTHGKLFMVGDRKQSIYRFRRADPSVFARMSDEIPPSGRLPLNVNFRSQPAVLNFVNQLFAPAIDQYEALVPFRNEQFSPTPAVEFLFATSDADDDQAPAPEFDPNRQPLVMVTDDDVRTNAAELRARDADWIARRIVELLDDPTPRIRTKTADAEGRPVLRRTEPGDIVILFRALSNVQQYESALQRYGLDYYLVGGKAFFAQQEIFDLLNLCRYLDDCDDLIALVGILRSPFFNLSDDAIHALAFHSADDQPESVSDKPRRSNGRRTHTLHETLYLEPPSFLPEEQQHRVQFAATLLSELRANKDRLPIAELLTMAVERTGYDAALLVEFLGSRKLANLRKLIEMARQFDGEDFCTLKDFATRLQTSVLDSVDEEFASTLPESGDVIRLMTIHQSKGLEFPVVFVADIDRKGPPKASDAILHPQWGALVRSPDLMGDRPEHLGLEMYNLAEQEADAEESIRLFYVACTRAADYLILTTGQNGERPTHLSWLRLIEDRFDPLTGLLKTDSLLGSSASSTADREAIPDIRVHRTPPHAKPYDAERESRTPLSQLTGSIITADAEPLPSSARAFPRNVSELSTISVSQLEAIDERQSGTRQTFAKSIPTDFVDEPIDVDQATVLGTIIHAVLERADFTQPQQWPELLAAAARQSVDPPGAEAMAQAEIMLKRFFTSPMAREFARAKTIHREIDFILPWASTRTKAIQGPSPQVAGVIDVLMQTDEGWEILDYKTGDFPLSTPDEHYLAPYELQLCVYACAVEQWFGEAPKSLSLVVFRPTVRRIRLEWTPGRWSQIQARVERALATFTAE